MWDTHKIVYALPTTQQNNGSKGAALIEAGDHSNAISVFQQQYWGQFFTIESCEKLIGN